MSDAIKAIEACENLYLHSISEPSAGTLRVVLLEARPVDPVGDWLASEALQDIRELLVGAKEIAHTAGCQIFELTWPSYIGYSVECESYRRPEPDDSVGEGRAIVEYMKSVYLSYLSQAMFTTDDYPGPYKHWALNCLNHIVNIASVDRPDIVISISTDYSAQAAPTRPH